MSFRIRGLDPAPFRRLFGLSDDALRAQGVTRCIADAPVGYPCRIELRDVEPGTCVLLLNYEHQPARTAFRASHAIFVREGAEHAAEWIDQVPVLFRRRLVSLRGFDDAGMMRAAEAIEGTALEGAITRLFADPQVDYLQAHYAARGCYAARIERA